MTLVAELLFAGPLACVSRSLPLRYALDAADVHTVGRAAGASLVLDAPEQPRMVSREHLSLRRVATADGAPEWRLEDPGSTNGTTVNGRRVASARLCDGDVIGVGSRASVVRFRYAVRCAEDEEVQHNQREAVVVHRGPDGVLTCGPGRDSRRILVVRGAGGRLLLA